MIKLNLLPQKEKDDYKTEIMRRFVVFFSIGILIIMTVFALLLGAEYLILQFQLNPEMQRLSAEKETEKFKKAEEFENQIKEINRKTSLVLNAKSQSSPILPILEKITKSGAGDNSYLKTIIIDSSSGNINIKGFALTRDQVIKIQDNLQKEKSFINIGAPYSNFLKQKNIDFSFDFKFAEKQQ